MKDIILTGVSRGLGRSLFLSLNHQTDIRLTCMGRHVPDNKEKISGLFIVWDFAKPDQMPQIDHALLDETESIVFINNAGTIAPIGEIGELSDKQLEEAAYINFVSPMAFCNQLVGFCRRKKRKLKIINISSGAADHPIAGWGAYCSTKAAFKMFLDVLAEQGKADRDVEVIHVDPGVMDTDMQEQIRASTAASFPRLAEFRSYKVNGKLRDPDEVAQEIIRKYIL